MRKIGIILCGGLFIIVFGFSIFWAILTKSPDGFLYEDDCEDEPEDYPDVHHDDDSEDDFTDGIDGFEAWNNEDIDD